MTDQHWGGDREPLGDCAAWAGPAHITHSPTPLRPLPDGTLGSLLANQSLGHLLTDNTLRPTSCPGVREGGSMRICISSFDYGKWSLTRLLENLPEASRELIQFSGPQGSLPSVHPKPHPGPQRHLPRFKQGWHGGALGSHPVAFPQSHHTFLAPRAATRNKLWSSGCLLHSDPAASRLLPTWNLSWSLTLWPSDFLTHWPPDTLVRCQPPPPLCIPGTYLCIYLPPFYAFIAFTSWSFMKAEIIFISVVTPGHNMWSQYVTFISRTYQSECCMCPVISQYSSKSKNSFCPIFINSSAIENNI